MDNQEDSAVPPPCEEAWFDAANLCGKEFELPNISSLVSPKLISQSQQVLDTPDLLESTFVSDTKTLSDAGDDFPPLPIVKMAPPVIANTVPLVPRREARTLFSSRTSHVEVNSFDSVVNHQTSFFRSSPSLNFGHVAAFPFKNQPDLHIAISSGFYWNCLDANISLRNRQFRAYNSTNLPRFSSNTPPTHGHLNTFKSLSNNYSSSGSQMVGTPSRTSLFSSDNSITYSRTRRSISQYWAHVLGMINNPGYRAGESYIKNALNHLQNSRHRTRAMKTVSFSMRNQLESSTLAPQSYGRRLTRDLQNFSAIPSQIGQISSNVSDRNYDANYVRKERAKEFPTYSTAFGGHRSFHAKARKMGANIPSGSDAMRRDSLGVADGKIEGSTSPKATKKRPLSYPRQEKPMKKSNSEDIVKERCHQSRKRIKEESSPVNANENSSTPVSKVVKKEPPCT